MARDPAKVLAYQIRYREKNREKLRADAAVYKAANAEKIRATSRGATARYRVRSPERYLFQCAKDRAKVRGIEFSLSLADVVIPEFCPVLGVKLRHGTVADKDSSPSIDRIRNAEGYHLGNIVIVSFRANRLKSDADATELRAVADFYGSLGA